MPADLSKKSITRSLSGMLNDIEKAKNCGEDLRRFRIMAEMFSFVHVYFHHILKNCEKGFMNVLKKKCEQAVSIDNSYPEKEINDARQTIKTLSKLILEKVQKVE